MKVVVRVRPLNSAETKEGFKMITKVNTIDGTIKVEIPRKDASNHETPAKTFTFDTVFAPEVKQVKMIKFNTSLITTILSRLMFITE